MDHIFEDNARYSSLISVCCKVDKVPYSNIGIKMDGKFLSTWNELKKLEED